MRSRVRPYEHATTGIHRSTRGGWQWGLCTVHRCDANSGAVHDNDSLHWSQSTMSLSALCASIISLMGGGLGTPTGGAANRERVPEGPSATVDGRVGTGTEHAGPQPLHRRRRLAGWSQLPGGERETEERVCCSERARDRALTMCASLWRRCRRYRTEPRCPHGCQTLSTLARCYWRTTSVSPSRYTVTPPGMSPRSALPPISRCGDARRMLRRFRPRSSSSPPLRFADTRK